jgi:hypothetical protein
MIDVDGSGDIEYEEFAHWFGSAPPPPDAGEKQRREEHRELPTCIAWPTPSPSLVPPPVPTRPPSWRLGVLVRTAAGIAVLDEV